MIDAAWSAADYQQFAAHSNATPPHACRESKKKSLAFEEAKDLIRSIKNPMLIRIQYYPFFPPKNKIKR
jgi:hypothetical protein